MVYYSQNGYSVLDDYSDCRKYDIKSGLGLYLRPNACGYVLANFARRFNRNVEGLNTTDCHGFSRRRISGSSDWSNHASGTAIDLNAVQHPQGRSGTFTANELSDLRHLLSDYDEVIKWGGDYRYTKDEMHFEIDARYEAVQLVARRLRRNNRVRLSRLKPGNRNLDVYMVKRALSRRGYSVGTLNDYFSVAMKSAYAAWQRHLGYSGSSADGLPGETSLEKLGFTVI